MNNACTKNYTFSIRNYDIRRRKKAGENFREIQCFIFQYPIWSLIRIVSRSFKSIAALLVLVQDFLKYSMISFFSSSECVSSVIDGEFCEFIGWTFFFFNCISIYCKRYYFLFLNHKVKFILWETNITIYKCQICIIYSMLHIYIYNITMPPISLSSCLICGNISISSDQNSFILAAFGFCPKFAMMNLSNSSKRSFSVSSQIRPSLRTSSSAFRPMPQSFKKDSIACKIIYFKYVQT